MQQKLCEYCGKELNLSSKRKYCNDSCKNSNYEKTKDLKRLQEFEQEIETQKTKDIVWFLRVAKLSLGLFGIILVIISSFFVQSLPFLLSLVL